MSDGVTDAARGYAYYMGWKESKPMSDFVPLDSAELKGAVQSLLDAKRFARDIENFIDGIIPLVADSEMSLRLQKAIEAAQETQQLFRDLYARNARDAFSMRK